MNSQSDNDRNRELIRLYRIVQTYERALNEIANWDFPKVWDFKKGEYIQPEIQKMIQQKASQVLQQAKDF